MSQPRLNWPTIGYQTIDEFNTEGLASIFYDEANYYGLTNLPNTGNEYSCRNSDSTVPMPHVQELENYAIEARL